MSSVTSQIGTLNEKPLHASLKQWMAEPGDRFEVPLDGFFIDVVRDELLIEIQTGGFSPLKKKLRQLTKSHPVRLVYPIAAEKWLVQPPALNTIHCIRGRSMHTNCQFTDKHSSSKLLSFSVTSCLLRSSHSQGNCLNNSLFSFA